MNRTSMGRDRVGGPRPRVRGTPRRPADGFTLVELLVGVVIIGVLGTMSFQAGTETLRSARVSAAASEMSFTLLRARQSALNEHTLFFLTLNTNAADRVRTMEIVRDDGSGVYEADDDEVVQVVIPDQDIRLGDGRGNFTSLPEVDPQIFVVGFGPRGEARDPTDGTRFSGFVNVTSLVAERGGWVKYSAIDIALSGAIRSHFHREPI